MKISVIIPVYNAAPFVRKAVESALDQPEVGEVILIDDGGPDESLSVCKSLESEFEKVRLFTHANNVNLGAGLTRNVGIENAKYDYIAFLDADDYYLPDRFRAERTIFAEKPETDGVYGAAGRHYYSEDERARYRKLGTLELVTTKRHIPPEELFETMLSLRPSHGFITLDTLTVKRSVFDNVGRFTDTVLHEDTEILFKLAYFCKLEPGELDEPVSMIGVHYRNRISRDERGSRKKEIMYERLMEWSIRERLPEKYQNAFRTHRQAARIKRSNPVTAAGLYFIESVRNPMFRKYPTFFYSTLDHMFGGRITRMRRKFKKPDIGNTF